MGFWFWILLTFFFTGLWWFGRLSEQPGRCQRLPSGPEPGDDNPDKYSHGKTKPSTEQERDGSGR